MSIKDNLKIQSPQSAFEGALEVAVIAMMRQMILEIVSKILPNRVAIDFDRFYIADLREHWKEITEQLLCEALEK